MSYPTCYLSRQTSGFDGDIQTPPKMESTNKCQGPYSHAPVIKHSRPPDSCPFRVQNRAALHPMKNQRRTEMEPTSSLLRPAFHFRSNGRRPRRILPRFGADTPPAFPLRLHESSFPRGRLSRSCSVFFTPIAQRNPNPCDCSAD